MKAMIYVEIVLIKHQKGSVGWVWVNCSLTRLTFALHESVRGCATTTTPQRFIDVDRVTSRGLRSFNYNTLLPNKSNLLRRRLAARFEG